MPTTIGGLGPRLAQFRTNHQKKARTKAGIPASTPKNSSAGLRGAVANPRSHRAVLLLAACGSVSSCAVYLRQ